MLAISCENAFDAEMGDRAEARITSSSARSASGNKNNKLLQNKPSIRNIKNGGSPRD